MSDAVARAARLKVGVVGCGRVARAAHLPALARAEGVELVALADGDAESLRAAAPRAPRATLHADWRELVESSGAEAVVVCLPNALHAEAATAALEAGRHVYLEKPLATNLADARAVVAAWRRAGTVGMIGFNYRFNRLYAAARRHVLSGRLGGLVAARTVFSTAERDAPSWKRARGSGGGALLDLGSHHADLVRFVFGREVREVSADVWSRRGEDDCAALRLRLSGGLIVQSFFSTAAVEEDRLEIYGDAGKLGVDRYLSLDVRVTDPTLRGARVKRLRGALGALRHGAYLLEKLRAPANEPSYATALLAFVAAARGVVSRDVKPDLEDGFRSLAVVVAAEESARTRRPVTVSEE
ncbi:MAG TPA: Gfo/Idh/MocA family oxidoreductase [Pyrinomonadaceae bacterium]|jgi:predicted dehydrogenase|nr:Gfo/Idh/MocA family oxidoreductase [Pyrinomonadaceae bacterium]